MPLYDYRCAMGHEFDRFLKVAECESQQFCGCGEKATKVIKMGPMVINDCQPFRSMVDGKVINSKSEYRAHLRQHNCIEVGNDSSIMQPVRKPLKSPPGLKEEIIRQANEKLRS